MERKIILICISVMLFCRCTSNMRGKDENHIPVKFGRIEKVTTSILQHMSFVKLETTEKCLIEKINQIEIFNDKIYILDDSGLYVFGLDGTYLKRLYRSGDGPGEFLTPVSFWIDQEGSVFVLDWALSRLLRYDIESLAFIEKIVMPFQNPLSFAKIPGQDLFAYYYPPRPQAGIEKKQVYIADKSGNIKKILLDSRPSARVLHGNRSDFYLCDDELNFYPYFSNKTYRIGTDSLYGGYELLFKENTFPDDEFFTKYENTGDVMKEIWHGDHNWIRLIYIYETEEDLAIKYYIKKDFYVSVLNKSGGKTINFKHNQVNDDCGIGGKFPLPIGTYKNQFIGEIKPFDIDKDQVTNPQLKELMEDVSDESNQILVFYSIKI